MALAMARPYPHSKTGVYWVRKVVPEGLRAAVGKRELKRSLDTKDAKVARNLAPAVLAEFNAILAAARDPVGQAASLRQIDAAIGTWYREQLARYANDPGDADHWDAVRSYYSDLVPRPDASDGNVIVLHADPTHTAETEALLRAHGLRADAATVRSAAPRFAATQFRFADAMFRRADLEGDWSPDATLARFPTSPATPVTEAPSAARPVSASPLATPGASKQPLGGLVAGWWAEAGRTLSPKTYEAYAATVRLLEKSLGHDDGTRVTTDDIIRFKDERLATINARTGRPLSGRTVKDGDLAALKAVLGWAFANKRLTTNPAAGVTVKVGRSVQARDRGFSDVEANAILAAASSYKPGRESAKLALAKRWVPWLCAYTGARVGEMAQLRREDVRQEDGHWIVWVTPEAGTVKDKKARAVPLHPHLVEMGFPQAAQAAEGGYLFLTPGAGGQVRWQIAAVKNRLQEFTRETVADPNVQPLHAWRHRFMTLSRQWGMDDDATRAITGHAPGSVHARYGSFTVGTLVREVSKLPRYPEGTT
jgi:integrase